MWFVLGWGGILTKCRDRPMDSFHKGLHEPKEAPAMLIQYSGLKCDTERETFHMFILPEQQTQHDTYTVKTEGNLVSFCPLVGL